MRIKLRLQSFQRSQDRVRLVAKAEVQIVLLRLNPFKLAENKQCSSFLGFAFEPLAEAFRRD